MLKCLCTLPAIVLSLARTPVLASPAAASPQSPSRPKILSLCPESATPVQGPSASSHLLIRRSQ